MRLRPAVPEDAPALAALEEALFGPDAWSEGAVLEEVSGPGRRAVVAVEGDEPVGYAVTMSAGDVVDLQRIGVAAAYQRRGVARALLAAVLTDAGDADRMLLEVSASNAAALAFYAAAEFVEIDRRRRYYRDGTDAVVMRRPLGRAARGGRG